MPVWEKEKKRQNEFFGNSEILAAINRWLKKLTKHNAVYANHSIFPLLIRNFIGKHLKDLCVSVCLKSSCFLNGDLSRHDCKISDPKPV